MLGTITARSGIVNRSFLAKSTRTVLSSTMTPIHAVKGPKDWLVASPPVGCCPEGLWAELEFAFLNTYQARWQYVIDTLGHGFAQGKTMLWRKADLDSAGGIAALGKYRLFTPHGRVLST